MMGAACLFKRLAIETSAVISSEGYVRIVIKEVLWMRISFLKVNTGGFLMGNEETDLILGLLRGDVSKEVR